MNKTESVVKGVYEKNGFAVLTAGWPDMLAIRKNENGAYDVRFVEVKSPKDQIRPNQAEMHAALREAGIFVTVHAPNRTKKLYSGVY